MNRKTRIIISITGIVIVLLILTGLTYAYYITRIKGNNKSNSISVTTANLVLQYNDGNKSIIANNIMPQMINIKDKIPMSANNKTKSFHINTPILTLCIAFELFLSNIQTLVKSIIQFNIFVNI